MLVERTIRQADGHYVYDSTWAEGRGTISKHVATRDGGLRIETWVSLGTVFDSAYMQPTGIVVVKEQERSNGFSRWTVACMQKNDGTDPTVGTALTFESYVPFTYPGRAKAYSVTITVPGVGTSAAKDVFLSPPNEALVLATHTVTYQTSATVGTLPNTLWNPTDWAVMRATWVAWQAAPRSRVQALKGYRAVNSGGSGTSGGTGFDTSVLGERVYASSAWSLDLSGGPADPGGTTWTLHASTELAFIGYDGTKYYRRTVVTATPAAQAALPV
jgi:hypothetical protein